jgi:hypothetical protein
MFHSSKTVLLILFFLLFCFSVEAMKGPIVVNVDVAPGKWKAMRLRSLPKDAVVALEVKTDGTITAVLTDSTDYQRFPNARRPLFMGLVEKKLSFSVSIPESGHYYFVLDNRSGKKNRSVTVTAAAAHGKMNRINAANTILRLFERKLHQIFIFNPFPIGVEQCDSSRAFSDRTGIFLCAGYVTQLYDSIGDEQKAKYAMSFSIFHEVGRILLGQWNHPLAAQKTTADEFATVLMVMGQQTEALAANAENFSQNRLVTKELTEFIKGDRHPLSEQRARKILVWLQDFELVRKWQKFLVPHMQTMLLEKLQQHPTEWTDLGIVEQELASRGKKLTRQNPYVPAL